MKVVAIFLALAAATHAASVASPLDLIDNLQELLVNPEAAGIRLKRSTGEWDKEFDLGVVGVSFKIKYNDPSNLMKGGHAIVTFPGQKFFHGLHFDDVELDIHFNGGDHFDGLFDMKVDYKFVQKYTFLADRPQEGTLMVERKMEGGMWKTKMTIADPHHTPNPFFDFSVESDRKTKLHGVFKYDADNHWEIKVDRVPGQSITGVVTINGMEYKLIGTLDMAAKKLNVKLMGFQGRTHELDFKINTGAEYGFFVTGDVHGPVDIKMVVKKDMKKIDFVVKYNNVNYAYIKLNGDAVMQGVIPTKVDYIMKYNIMDSEMEGKAKVNYNGQAPAKTLKMSFVPKHGEDLNLDFKMTGPSMQGWRFDFESQRSGTTLTKFHHEIDLVNNANIFDMNMKGELDMDPMSIFYNFFCWKIGKCFTHGTRDTKIMYNKKDKNFLMGKMHFEDKSMVDGQKFQEKKLDTTKQPYELIWYQPISPSWMSSTRDMFGVDQVEVRAWHQVGKELKIETNVGEMKLTVRRTPDYFVEFIRMGETMLKSKTDVTPATFTTTIDTLFYLPSNSMLSKVFCMYGKGCFNKRQGHMKVVVDRVNKNAFMNKFSVESTVHKDDRMALEMSVNTMVTPYTFHMNAPYFLPRFFNDINRKTIDATIMHEMGSKLEVKSNCPEFETFIITTTGNKRSVVLNGKELTVVDFQRGARRISQTTELPSGEHLTTTVEWTEDSLKKNQATITVEVTPNRKFEGIFGWDFQTLSTGNFHFDVKGENPWVGNYAIDRHANWEMNKPRYMFNWVGKSEFKTGPFSSFSPIDTKMNFVFNTRKMVLNADMVETMGGKQWGLKIHKNRFSILTGNAA